MENSSKEVSVALNILSGIFQTVVVVIFYFLVIVTVKNAATAAYLFSFEVFGNVAVEASPGRNVEVTIRTTDTKKVAVLLKEKGIIANENSFWIREKLTITKNDPIEPGVYTLNTSMNYEEIINTITHRETEKEESAV